MRGGQSLSSNIIPVRPPRRSNCHSKGKKMKLAPPLRPAVWSAGGSGYSSKLKVCRKPDRHAGWPSSPGFRHRGPVEVVACEGYAVEAVRWDARGSQVIQAVSSEALRLRFLPRYPASRLARRAQVLRRWKDDPSSRCETWKFLRWAFSGFPKFLRLPTELESVLPLSYVRGVEFHGSSDSISSGFRQGQVLGYDGTSWWRRGASALEF